MDKNSKDTIRYKLAVRRRFYRIRLRRSKRWVLTTLVILPLVLVYGCSIFTKTGKSTKTPAVPVLTAAATQQNVPIYLAALGSVTPVKNVTVHTQVDGQLMHVYFSDGQMVQEGELLADIDPRPYEAQLTQYEGALVRDKALLANARIDLDRYKTLFAQDSISQQTLATQQSLVKQYEGAIKSDQGQIEGVKVNLIYCRITSPITGKVGLIEVDPGNIVHTTDTNGIVVINSMSPIYVDFAIPEDSLPQVARKIAAGEKLMAIAKDRAQNKTLATGILLTTDNQIDTSTGTITLRAQFANADNMLFPNQFVNIFLLIDVVDNATVVPTPAVQYGNAGNYVYILNADQTVSIKPVTIIASLDGETAITGEINPGQKVITEGTDKLKEGTLVNPVVNTASVGSNTNGPV